MAKYTEQFKLAVVKEFEAGGSGSSETGRRYGVDPATVRKWVALYRVHGKARLQKKYGHYSPAFKQFMLEQMESEGLSERRAATRFNIRNRAVIGCGDGSMMKADSLPCQPALGLARKKCPSHHRSYRHHTPTTIRARARSCSRSSTACEWRTRT